jgi:hypothetical protein
VHAGWVPSRPDPGGLFLTHGLMAVAVVDRVFVV